MRQSISLASEPEQATSVPAMMPEPGPNEVVLASKEVYSDNLFYEGQVSLNNLA
jgi:hypothetical protein